MRIAARHKAAATVPTSSMADIAFLLIIFFMWTFQVEVDRTQVQLPSSQLRLEVPRDAAYVSLTDAGLIRVSDGEAMSTPVELQDVISFAAELSANFPERPVVIKADTEVDYQHIDSVLDALRQGKVKQVYLLTDQQVVE